MNKKKTEIQLQIGKEMNKKFVDRKTQMDNQNKDFLTLIHWL